MLCSGLDVKKASGRCIQGECELLFRILFRDILYDNICFICSVSVYCTLSEVQSCSLFKGTFVICTVV